MIHVTYDRTGHGLTIRGHACAAEYGRDVVCAAVSGLAYTLAGCVEQLYEKGLAEDAEICLACGEADIHCKAVAGFECTVSIVFDTVCHGLRQLADSFPEFVEFRCERPVFCND